MRFVDAAGMPVALYRLYDEDDDLLYVGITASTGERFRQHFNSKSWWQAVAMYRSEWYENRTAALAAESAAILAERPAHNRAGTVDPELRDLANKGEWSLLAPGVHLPAVIAFRKADDGGLYYTRTEDATWSEIQAGLRELEAEAKARQDEVDLLAGLMMA